MSWFFGITTFEVDLLDLGRRSIFQIPSIIISAFKILFQGIYKGLRDTYDQLLIDRERWSGLRFQTGVLKHFASIWIFFRHLVIDRLSLELGR